MARHDQQVCTLIKGIPQGAPLNNLVLLASAGIYRAMERPNQKARRHGRNRGVGVMTTLPNALTMTINHQPSPVLLTEEAQFATWLTGAPQKALV